jgi:hypothetical protein
MRMKRDPPNPTIQRTPTSAADFDRSAGTKRKNLSRLTLGAER